jgi:hypothetical protein
MRLAVGHDFSLEFFDVVHHDIAVFVGERPIILVRESDESFP